jgi:diamine N-acetyltransferase
VLVLHGSSFFGFLKPKEEQEDLVATNSDSIVHAKIEPTSKPFGIYADDVSVGRLPAIRQ